MKLFLVRHGEYVPETVDPEKSLSEKGKTDIHKIGESLKKEGYSVDEIFHSGKKRAQETAEILAKYILKDARISAQEGMDPNDDVKPWTEKIQNFNKNLMLVGHLPFMEKLSSLLLTGDEFNAVVEFDTGTTAILEKTSNDKWKLEKVIKV